MISLLREVADFKSLKKKSCGGERRFNRAEPSFYRPNDTKRTLGPLYLFSFRLNFKIHSISPKTKERNKRTRLYLQQRRVLYISVC